MFNRIFLFLGLIFLTVVSACTKKEEVVIPNNTAPPDHTVSNVVIQNYVNRLYISLIGRKPLTAELESGMSLLKTNQLAVDDRMQLIDVILAKPEYNSQLYSLANTQLLNNMDTAEYTFYITVFNSLLTQPDYAYAYDLLNSEINRLKEGRTILADLNSGSLTVIGMHRRLVNNYFYDQINMGTENYVISMYQNFLYREPTAYELTEGKKMVDGFSGIQFSQVGKSKNEFMDIFLSSGSYFEGQVRNLFVRYYFREPGSEEMASYANRYKASLNYKQLQKELLSSDEYVGL